MKKKIVKLFIILSIASLFIWGAFHFLHKVNGGFSPNQISPTAWENPHWQLSFSTDQQQKIDSLLQQKFTYLGKGGQSFVFVSEDGHFVLKFFKKKSSQEGILAQPFALESSWLAYKKLQKETGLVYLHLNKTEGLPPVTVFNKVGSKYILDVNELQFYIQNYATPLREQIILLTKQNDNTSLKKLFSAVLQLILFRSQQGVEDRDFGVINNFGVSPEGVIITDIGRFANNEGMKNPEAYTKDLEIRASRFRKWLAKNYPELLPLFEEALSSSTVRLQPQ